VQSRTYLRPPVLFKFMVPRLIVMCLSLGIFAHANSVTFVTPTGALAAGESVSASAVFTPGTNSLTISLTNMLSAAAMKDAGQLLSDLFFTLNTAATGAAGVTSSNGTFIDLQTNNSVGSATPTAQSGNPADKIGWFFSNSGTNSWHLDGLNGGSSNNPGQLIIGGTTADNAYPMANSSLAGNDPHNPFVQGTGVFVLDIPGVTSMTNVTAATFSFSTSSGIDVTGQLQPTPEPRFYTLLLSAGLFLGLIWRRRFTE
jgi:hypothetical protein